MNKQMLYNDAGFDGLIGWVSPGGLTYFGSLLTLFLLSSSSSSLSAIKKNPPHPEKRLRGIVKNILSFPVIIEMTWQ